MISNKNILDLEIRRQIYNFILKHPGLHQREISRRMKIPITTFLYHLRFLEKQDLIIIKTTEGYKRIYASQHIGTKEKEILNLLRKKLPQQILLYMILTTACSQIELSEELEKKPATISYHLNKFKEIGLIEEYPVCNGILKRGDTPRLIYKRQPIKSEVIYRITSLKTVRMIYDMFIIHKNSLYYSESVNIVLYLIDNIVPTKNIIKIDEAFDQLFTRVYDVFPHPYHV